MIIELVELLILVIKKNLSNIKKLKNSSFSRIDFLIFEAKKAFIKALILYYFDLNHYIKNKINISSYIIEMILN